MSCHNYCSGNYSSGSLRNVCNIPVTYTIALCSTNVSNGEAVCLPSNCQDNSWLLNNCQETYSEPTRDNCGEPTSHQPANCDSRNYEASCCPSTAHYVPRPRQGTGFLPVSSSISASYLPVSCRPLSRVSSSCRPLSPLLYNSHSLGCVPTGYRPLNHLSNSYRPLSFLTYGCQPLGSLPCGSQPFRVVSSSFIPLRPFSSDCQPLTHIFSTCRPSCTALEYR
ncbi:keratin-associated protein 26-1 [Orycteropus afer afer]|uniref:Keratin-associated protein n=1 Tax=Orycteropus afer afer TaxID=1230840 RepID=A0A8B7A195_ORYAF|nr:keratin-associated protein 26-1 [Orycteropus afer afer]